MRSTRRWCRKKTPPQSSPSTHSGWARRARGRDEEEAALIAVVTISSQFGAGAREIARLVAERLGIQYVDQEILVEAARALGVSTESVMSVDERVDGRLANLLRRFIDRSEAAGGASAKPGTGGLDVLLGRSYSEAAGHGTSIDTLASAVQSEQPDLRPHAAPDGTVTLLFTDIVGSTAMNERLGDRRWLELLRAHNAVVRKQVQAHGGFEVKTAGDGFMVAFGSARRGLQCAIAIQRAFAQRNAEHATARAEPAEEAVQVRAGLHTGEAIREADDFYGRHVNLASRIAGEARGGEILVSSLLKELVEGSGDIRFGEGREVELKGMAGRQRLFEVTWGVPEVSDAHYLSTLRGIIRDLAAHGDVLILGRGGQVILSDWPGAFHVLLVAPLEYRIDFVARWEELTAEEASKRLHEIDKGRAAFHRKFFNVNADDASLYDLTLNTSRRPADEAAQIIGQAVQRA